ncbi:MAG: hypothetical protein IH596_02625 [Bacteroidales bacterium]|nr:hypothetical protein [Bacteroidales bacterium]
MRSLYRLDKSFGPGGSFAGMVLVLVGIILIPFYWTGSILILIGAFVGFSGTGCEVDTKKQRVRACQLLFGLIRSGDWIGTDNFQGIRVVRTTRSYRTFSLSNRTMETKQEDYRVVLEAASPRSRIEVMKCSSKETAHEKAGELAKALGMKFLET